VVQERAEGPKAPSPGRVGQYLLSLQYFLISFHFLISES